jgi:hypothetical protein
MTSQLNQLRAQQRYAELVRSADEARPAHESYPARSAASPRRHIGRLLAPRRRKTGRVVDGVRRPTRNSPRGA